MVNLNKQRMVIYAYLLTVFTLIFGLSFTVEGNKISGAAIVEILKSVEKINWLTFNLFLFAFLLSLAFAIFIIRHAHEIKKEIHHKKIKLIGIIAVILLVFSFASLGFYFQNENMENEGNGLKVTGNVVRMEKITAWGTVTMNGEVIDSDMNGENDIDIYGPGRKYLGEMYEPYEWDLRFRGDDDDDRLSLVNVQFDTTSQIDETVQRANELSRQGKYTEATEQLGSLLTNPPLLSNEQSGDIELLMAAYYHRDDNPRLRSIYLDAAAKSYENAKDNEQLKKKKENLELVVKLLAQTRIQPTKTVQKTLQQLGKTDAYLGASLVLKHTLGTFAYEAISDYCKEQYDGSDYAGGTDYPQSHSTNTQPLFTGQSYGEPTNPCVGEQTTVTAQAQKTTLGTGFTYQTSWTITPCKENIEYNIYLANSVDDKIGMATGIANKGFAKSESKQFSNAKDYQKICVWTSDGMIGDEGYACFDVVSVGGQSTSSTADTSSSANNQIDNVPSQDDAQQCTASGGEWKGFALICADKCGTYSDIECAQENVQSCDCGPDKCWNGNSCINGHGLNDYLRNTLTIEEQNNIFDQT